MVRTRVMESVRTFGRRLPLALQSLVRARPALSLTPSLGTDALSARTPRYDVLGAPEVVHQAPTAPTQDAVGAQGNEIINDVVSPPRAQGHRRLPTAAPRRTGRETDGQHIAITRPRGGSNFMTFKDMDGPRFGAQKMYAAEPTYLDIDMSSFGDKLAGAMLRYKDENGQMQSLFARATRRAHQIHTELPQQAAQSEFQYSVTPMFRRGRGRLPSEELSFPRQYFSAKVYEHPTERISPSASVVRYELTDDLIRRYAHDLPPGHINVVDATLQGKSALTDEPLTLTAHQSLQVAGKDSNNNLVGPTGQGLIGSGFWRTPLQPGEGFVGGFLDVKVRTADDQERVVRIPTNFRQSAVSPQG